MAPHSLPNDNREAPILNTAINTSMTPREWGMLLVLSILWGGSFYFVGVAVAELPTFTIVFLRVGIAALGLHVILRVVGERMPAGVGVWAAFFAMGLLNNLVPFSLIAWGQSHVASGLASILLATTPVFTVVVAHFLTADERFSVGRLAGIAAGIIGVVILVGSEALHGLGFSLLAHVALLGAALFYAFAGVFGRRFQRMGVTPLATATGQITASSLLLLPLALAVDQPWTLAMPSGGTWLAIAGLALLSIDAGDVVPRLAVPVHVALSVTIGDPHVAVSAVLFFVHSNPGR